MTSRKNHTISTARIDQIKLLLLRAKVDPRKFFMNKEEEKLNIINEALTHTSAQAKYNHEKLEFLGDAVLRLAASEFIDNQFPNMKVGERSELRAQLVSDKWLSEVGKNIKIEEHLIMGPKASGDNSALSTLQAEATEALIGAIYECFKDLKLISDWLYPYWLTTSTKVLEDPYRKNSKSALQEWSQSNGFKLPIYENQEISQQHGDPKRFFCKVHLAENIIGKGWGGSRKEAEKDAANLALKHLKNLDC